VGLAALGIATGAGTRRSPENIGEDALPEAALLPIGDAPRASSKDSRPRPSAEEAARLAARRAAFVALVARVRELSQGQAEAPTAGALIPDEATIARLERALGEASATLSDGRDVSRDDVVAAARREIFDLGALSRLFEDDDVTEIQIFRFDDVVLLADRRRIDRDIGFSSEDAVATALRRLCVTAGEPLRPDELVVERRLPGGARLFALMPALVAERAHVIVVKRPTRADASLEELVRSGAVSRVMASFLGQCISARARILVTSPLGGGGATVLGALSCAGDPEDRVVILQSEDPLAIDVPHAVTLSVGSTREETASTVRAVTRLAPDRLVVSAIRGPVVAELASALGAGLEGVLALGHGPTLRHVVRRLAAELGSARPGQTAGVVREELAAIFDLAVEVARLPDGRLRVLRVAELDTDAATAASVLRDIFTFTVERTAAGGALEGTFASTGVVPRLAEELMARGLTVDSAIFRRHVRVDPDTQLAVRGADIVRPEGGSREESGLAKLRGP